MYWSEKSSCWKRVWSNGDQSKEVTATSRRLHVATLQRRDVSSRSAPYHLKYEWFRNQGIGRRTNEGTEFQSRREDGDLEEVPGLRIVSHFLWILEECFLYQTLSSFHSLCSRSIPRVTSNPIICDGLKFDLLYYSIVY